jgi:hypothetical protein
VNNEIQAAFHNRLSLLAGDILPGCGHDIFDIPILEAAGHLVCVGNNKKLFYYAAIKGWRNI